MFLPLNALGHDGNTHVVGEMADSRDESPAGGVAIDLAGQCPVQLYDLRPDVYQSLEAGEAAPGVVHRYPHAALVDELYRLAQLDVGLELALLGDLHHDPFGRQLRQDLQEGGPVEQARRRVHSQVGVMRAQHLRAETVDRQAGGVQFQLHPEADVVRFAEISSVLDPIWSPNRVSAS